MLASSHTVNIVMSVRNTFSLVQRKTSCYVIGIFVGVSLLYENESRVTFFTNKISIPSTVLNKYQPSELNYCY